MQEIVKRVQRVAATESAILITGETGTGKELLARLIHRGSGRTGQFVAINYGAIPETLKESQLFGHRRGSFTDATADSPGAARQAAGGTLFLDEIGEFSTGNQGKLLRLIKNREIHTLGVPQPEKIDVRIVAATNSNLAEMMQQRQFRQDLFFRLQTFQINIPPLRERPDDLVAIARYLIDEVCREHKKKVTFTHEAIESMKKLKLRGNARELRAIIERTVINATDGTEVGRDAVEALAARRSGLVGLTNVWEGFNLSSDVHNYERALIEAALKQAKGGVTEAARLLGISHQLLNRKIKTRYKDLMEARKVVIHRQKSIINKTKVAKVLRPIRKKS